MRGSTAPATRCRATASAAFTTPPAIITLARSRPRISAQASTNATVQPALNSHSACPAPLRSQTVATPSHAISATATASPAVSRPRACRSRQSWPGSTSR